MLVPRWLRIGLKSILTVGVLVALVMAVDLTALAASLQRAQWQWVGVAVLLLPLNLTLDAWVWKRLLDTILDRVPIQALTGALLSGLALGFWTPARAGEYVARACFLPTGDRWSIALTVFAQRMVDMAIGVNVGFVALLGAFYSGAIPPTGPWVAAALIGLGTGTGLTVFVLRPRWAHRAATWIVGNRSRITERTALLRRLSPKQGRDVLSGSLARYVVFTGQLACLGLAFAPSASWGLLAAGATLTFYAKYLIPSLVFLDLGIREGGAVFFFGQLGLGAAAGLNAALVLFVINVVIPAVLGLPLVARLTLPDTRDGGALHAPAVRSGS